MVTFFPILLAFIHVILNAETAEAAVLKAVAFLTPNGGSTGVSGKLLFQQGPDKKLIVTGRITGLTPGKHALDIHQNGDLTDKCNNLGDHFNPVGHGQTEHKSGGDLGDVTADAHGVAIINTSFPGGILTISAGPATVVGRGVAVHETVHHMDAGMDGNGMAMDSEAMKFGMAGPALACAVIGYSNN